MSYLMPYGDLKGTPIEDVPTDEIQRARKWSKIRPDTAAEFDKELARRRGGDGPATGHGRPVDRATVVREILHAPGPVSGPVEQRMRDIISVGADRLQSCAYTTEAFSRLIELVNAKPAPAEDDVPF